MKNLISDKEEANKIFERLLDVNTFTKESEKVYEEFLNQKVKWIPQKRDLKWTRNYITNSGKNKIIIWVTSDGVILMFKEIKKARIIEVNISETHDAYFELGKIGKCLKKLGWYVDMIMPIVNCEEKNKVRWNPLTGDIAGVTINNATY